MDGSEPQRPISSYGIRDKDIDSTVLNMKTMFGFASGHSIKSALDLITHTEESDPSSPELAKYRQGLFAVLMLNGSNVYTALDYIRSLQSSNVQDQNITGEIASFCVEIAKRLTEDHQVPSKLDHADRLGQAVAIIHGLATYRFLDVDLRTRLFQANVKDLIPTIVKHCLEHEEYSDAIGALIAYGIGSRRSTTPNISAETIDPNISAVARQLADAVLKARKSPRGELLGKDGLSQQAFWIGFETPQLLTPINRVLVIANALSISSPEDLLLIAELLNTALDQSHHIADSTSTSLQSPSVPGSEKLGELASVIEQLSQSMNNGRMEHLKEIIASRIPDFFIDLAKVSHNYPQRIGNLEPVNRISKAAEAMTDNPYVKSQIFYNTQLFNKPTIAI